MKTVGAAFERRQTEEIQGGRRECEGVSGKYCCVVDPDGEVGTREVGKSRPGGGMGEDT